MKKREGDPWVSPPVYGRSLRGLGVNLLVQDTARAVAFARDVLGLTIVYADADLAVLRYDAHALLPRTRVAALRGGGVELRVHDGDPDAAVAAAHEHGYGVLDPATDKPHGLREAYIIDADGYVWVVDAPTTE
jgi:uncharacterized glyoxalase superfamily protein PhnB